MDKKILLLDTNVLLYDTECLDKFGENEVIIPLCVIEELDSLKDDSRKPEISHASREITRKIIELIGEENITNLRKGCVFKNSLCEETTLTLFDEREYYSLKNKEHNLLKPVTVDDWIIYSAQHLQATLITRDNNMLLKASGLCNAEIYFADNVKEKTLYKGYRILNATFEQLQQFTSENKMENIPELFEEKTEMFPNEFLIMQSLENPKYKLFGICKGNVIKRIDLDNLKLNGMKLKPMGLSQKLAFYLLLEEDLDAISFVGGSGTGKTSISIDYALNQVNKGIYSQMYYSKSMIGVSEDEAYGFVPGDVDEKMAEVVIPLSCTLELLNNITRNKGKLKTTEPIKTTDMLSGEALIMAYTEQGLLRILPLNYLRGMTITNKIVILDEGQNLIKSKMKTLITRISGDSKIIITGDDNQIDDKNLNKYNNGLAHFVEQGKNETFVAHLTLDLDTEESKRGRLSSFGNKL